MTMNSPDYWTANIPAQPFGTTVDYYISSTANNEISSRPLTAPQVFQFDVSNIAILKNRLSNVFPNLHLVNLY